MPSTPGTERKPLSMDDAATSMAAPLPVPERRRPVLGRLTGELLAVTVGQAVTAIGGLVGVRLLTRALAPAAYGELALAMTMVTGAQQTLLIPIYSSALRFFAPSAAEGRLTQYVGALRWMLVRGLA